MFWRTRSLPSRGRRIRKDGVTFLTAVRIPAADSNTAPQLLAPKPAFVQSELSWIGNSFVAFHAKLLADLAHPGQWLPNPYDQRTPFYAKLGPTGFDLPTAIVDNGYDPGVFLRATSSGFFMITDSDPFTFFTDLSASAAPPSTLGFTQLISGSGKYSASLDEGQLQIYSAIEGEASPPVAVSNDGEGCPKLLAWAADSERIACVADVPNAAASSNHGEVRIFDLKPEQHELSASTLQGFCTDDTDSQISAGSCAALENEYSYSEAHATGQARAFSPSGRWLAFTAASTDTKDNYLYWADLNEVPRTLKGRSYSFTAKASSALPTELSFSPDEKYLLFRQGNQLHLQDLSSATKVPQSLSLVLAGGTKCSEDFPSAPQHWCGDTELLAPFHWSPDSTAVAIRTPDLLTVVDIEQFPARSNFTLPATDCEQQCRGQFAFQPIHSP
jgi:hypothetical protein